jgi:hypothetical protein
MILQFATTYLPAASLNKSYSQYVEAVGGTAPYTYALISGSMPSGLELTGDGLISGIATKTGVYNFIIELVDANNSTYHAPFSFTVMDMVTLDNVTVDQVQFVTQFQNVLAKSGSWSTGLTTQTSQTLIDLVSAIGTFATSRIARAHEDSFPDTTQSDSAIRAIATMQGLRLSRKLPATVLATIVSTETQSLDPYTQFSAAGYSWFSTEQIVLTAGIPVTVVLKEGVVQTHRVSGLGTDLQAWVSVQDNFTVSDQDVKVSLNGTTINKTFGGLWNYLDLSGCADLTLNDGRLLVQFGSKNYGTVPSVNDVITIEYAVTQGETINSAITQNTQLTVSANTTLSGIITTNPSGGANEKSPVVYKNFASGTFGTYGSAVTKAQYHSLVNNYPGIVDAVTQAQREINPAALEWMNIIRVAALTNSPWDESKINEFLNYMQSVTMYSTKFLFQTPIPLARDIDLSVYCFNSVNSTSAVTALVKSAIKKLISKRPGILMTNLYESDLIMTAMAAAPGQISYVIVNKPSTPMIVTTPESPVVTYTIVESGGNLVPYSYAYAVSTDAPSPSGDGTIEIGSPSHWVFPQVTKKESKIELDWTATKVSNAVAYHVWGRRANYIGKIATVDPSVTKYEDVGGPDPELVPSRNLVDVNIRYNTINSLVVTTEYADRQGQVNLPIRDVLS